MRTISNFDLHCTLAGNGGKRWLKVGDLKSSLTDRLMATPLDSGAAESLASRRSRRDKKKKASTSALEKIRFDSYSIQTWFLSILSPVKTW